MDSNYWKNAYRDTWDMSSKRENAMIKWIADTSGLTAKSVGLGAGTKDFISGSADENNHQKGDALSSAQIYTSRSQALCPKACRPKATCGFAPINLKTPERTYKTGMTPFLSTIALRRSCGVLSIWITPFFKDTKTVLSP